MVDLVEAISTSMELAKRLRELNKKVGEADFKMLLADLSSALGDAKLEAANLKVEIAELKSEIGTLRAAAAQRSSEDPELDEGAYVFDDKSRHYCTACFDIRNQKVLLDRLTGPWTAFGTWKCPSCGKTFGSATG